MSVIQEGGRGGGKEGGGGRLFDGIGFIQKK